MLLTKTTLLQGFSKLDSQDRVLVGRYWSEMFFDDLSCRLAELHNIAPRGQ